MATSAETIRTDYPLPAYNYRVEIAGQTIAFSGVTGLAIGYEIGTFKESPITNQPGPRVSYFPGQPTAPTISLKKGVVKNVSIKALYGWIKTIQANQVEKKDVFIRLCDEEGEPIISWKATNAFPTKLSAPSFDAQSNDAAIEALDLQADFISIEET